MSGNGTETILIIAGIFIVVNLIIGMLLLSNRSTMSILSSAPIHSHHEKNQNQQ